MIEQQYVPTVEEYEREYKDWFEKKLPKKLKGGGELTDDEIVKLTEAAYKETFG